MKDWDEQHLHIKRWHDRILALAATSGDSGDYHLLEDYLHAYFQAAWSFKDWLINDPKTKLTKLEVETQANSSYLKVIGDIANGQKHLILTAKNRGDNRLGSGYVMVALTDKGGLITQSDLSISGNTKLTAVELVEASFQQWNDFLSAKGLNPRRDPMEEFMEIFEEAKKRESAEPPI